MNPRLVQASDIRVGDIIEHLGKVRAVHTTPTEVQVTLDPSTADPIRLHHDADVWVTRANWWLT